MNLNKLIAKAIAESKMPITRIAERSGMSRQHIYKICKGEKNISSINLEKLCKAINILPSSLYEGEIEQTVNYRIPVLGIIPAGVPIEAIEDILDYEEISPEMLKGGKEYFALKIKGDSMSPKYLDGDVVIFLKQDCADDSDDCCVYVNGYDATFKRIRLNQTGIVLQPINTNYEPMFFTNEQIEALPVRIIGKAVEIRRKI